jgi:uncharacterized Tic20 family protein
MVDTVQLKIEYSDGRSEQRTLGAGVHRVGREAGEIVLGDPNVSGTHLELRVANGELFLTDVGSSNGTFDATGARVHGSVKMSPHQPYRLGSSSLTWIATAPGVGASGGTAVMPQYGGAPPHAGSGQAPPPPHPGYAPPQSQWTPPPGNPGYGAYPAAAMAGPYGVPQEARTFGMLCHIGALAGYILPLGNVLGPLVFWLMKKDTHPFVDEQGKESLNFQITVTIAYAVFGGLSFFLIGIPFLLATGVAALVLEIIAGIKANSGISYRCPFTLRLLT